ncbi:hypothetical protein BDV10DRAFT_92701 [Aspergillus recurvatus]
MTILDTCICICSVPTLGSAEKAQLRSHGESGLWPTLDLSRTIGFPLLAQKSPDPHLKHGSMHQVVSKTKRHHNNKI